jgi:DNA-binding IclR family transcriptional regulator
VNNTLHNGLIVLQRLASTTEPFTISGLAEALALPKSHVHRLLQSLVEDGWVVQEPDRRYRIGLKPLELSSALLSNLPLRRAAVPALRRVVEATGYDAIVAQLAGDSALIIAAEYPRGVVVDAAMAVGRRLLLHVTACGKMLASTLPVAEQDALLGRLPLPAHSPNTLTTVDAVRAEWTCCRLANRALTRGEGNLAVASIAVPVRDHEQRVVGALGVPFPIEAWSEAHLDHLTATLHAAADSITRPGAAS